MLVDHFVCSLKEILEQGAGAVSVLSILVMQNSLHVNGAFCGIKILRLEGFIRGVGICTCKQSQRSRCAAYHWKAETLFYSVVRRNTIIMWWPVWF